MTISTAARGVPVSTPVRLVLLGWAGVLLFALMIVVAKGTADLGGAGLFGAVAVAMASWVWRRPSKAALVTTLAIAVLFTVEQVAYLVSDGHDTAETVGDAIGLVAGALLLAGATRALADGRASRR
jgi:hypothetical protein